MSVGAFANVVLLVLSFSATSTAVFRILKSRSVEGISMVTISLSLYACLTWTAYATLTGNHTQLATSAFASLGLLTALTIAHRNRAIRTGLVAVGLVTYASVAFALLNFVGVTGLGIAVSSLTFFVRAPQVLMAIRQPGGAGLSVASLGLESSQSILWSLTGIARGDIFLAGSSAYCMVTSTYVAARTSRARRAGRVVGQIHPATVQCEATATARALAA